MQLPFLKEMRIGAYILKQKLAGRKRYPLVLMLEPLFRCNLACVGCGKIDYPDAILNRRLTVKECLDAVDECGAPMVAIPGGEPLIHREIGEIVKGIVARKKFVSLCTNALLLEKKLNLFEPSPYLFFSVHLDGLKDHHDKSVCQEGVFDRALSAIKAAKAKGFTVNVNATIFDNHPAADIAAFLDLAKELGVGVSISPGYAYERAPDQEHFLNRRKTKELFRDVFARGKGKDWTFVHSGLFLDFLAGNQTYHCTPWGMPTRNIFGWQKPCYLLGEGYAKTFDELMETTDWDSYGTGRYEKCANCMAHCGYEPTAAEATFANPLKALKVAMFGLRTDGPMAPEIPLENQRPAEFVFSRHVEHELATIPQATKRPPSLRWRRRSSASAPPCSRRALAHAPLDCRAALFASLRLVCQLKGASIVRLHNGPHVHGDDLAVPNHDLAVDDGGSGLLGSAEENCRHRVMQCTGITDGVQIEREKVGAFAGFERADIGASEHPRATESGELEHLTRRHPLIGANRMRLRKEHVLARPFRRKQPEPQPRQQHGLAGFEQNVGRVVAGRAIHAEADLDAGGHVFLDRRNAGTKTHVGARTMGRAAAGGGEFLDLVVIDVDRVREPDIVPQPSERFHPIHRTQLKVLERVAFLIQGFTKVGVKPDLMLPGKGG